jgi:branched-chain amino acid aminotransferase
MSADAFANGCAYIEGRYLPIGEACIPILDTGFLRSDLTYDVVAVWNGKFFRLEDHLDRFERGWKRLRMKPDFSKGEIRKILFECVRRSGLRNAFVEMIITRGIDEDGSRDPRKFRNRLYAYAIPYVWIVKSEDQEAGINVVIAAKTVRIPPEAIDPTVKNFHWGDLVRGIFEAYDRGGYTVVLTDAKGHITEGPGFNIFIYNEGELLTPEAGVLEGITRKTVLDLADELGIPARLSKFGATALKGAEEVFISSTAGGVMPVTRIDGQPIGAGSPGKVTTLIRTQYWEAHDGERWTASVDYTA